MANTLIIFISICGSVGWILFFYTIFKILKYQNQTIILINNIKEDIGLLKKQLPKEKIIVDKQVD